MHKNIYLILSTFLIIAFIFGCTQPDVLPVEENLSDTGEVVDESQETTDPATQETTDPATQEITEPVTHKTDDKFKLLIGDTENHRVILVNRDKEVVWQYGCEETNDLGKCSFGSDYGELYRVYGASFAGENIIVTDYENNRILELTPDKKIRWTYGEDYGFGDGELNKPNYAVKNLETGNVLIADGLNNRVVEVTSAYETVWKYGCKRLNSAGKCAYGTELNELRNPYYVEYAGENYLITDSENNRVLEVSPDKQIVFEYDKLSLPYMATKLENGNYLISNSRANKVIEVTPEKEVVWSKEGLSMPTAAKRLDDGNTLIMEQTSNHIIEVDPEGEIVWEYGGSFGAKEGQLGRPRNFDI